MLHLFMIYDLRSLSGLSRKLENPRRCAHNYRVLMKDKDQATPQPATKKPARAPVSDAEFRRRLKNISEWRKKRLAQLRAKDSR